MHEGWGGTTNPPLARRTMKILRTSVAALLSSAVLLSWMVAVAQPAAAADADAAVDAATVDTKPVDTKTEDTKPADARPADTKKDVAVVPKDLVLKGDAKCTVCHDETEDSVLRIGKARHGTIADARTPTCTSCHGDSESHIHKPDGVKERPKTEISFSKGSSTTIATRDATCLGCHQGG